MSRSNSSLYPLWNEPPPPALLKVRIAFLHVQSSNFFLLLHGFSKTIHSFGPVVLLGPIPLVFSWILSILRRDSEHFRVTIRMSRLLHGERTQIPKIHSVLAVVHHELVFLQNHCKQFLRFPCFSKFIGFQHFPVSLLSQASCPPIFSLNFGSCFLYFNLIMLILFSASENWIWTIPFLPPNLSISSRKLPE